MKILLYVALSAILILLFFRLLTAISRKRNKLSPSDFAAKIEQHLTGDEGPWDWEYLVTVPFNDERLEPFRKSCLEIGDPPLTEWKVEQLKEIVHQLRRL